MMITNYCQPELVIRLPFGYLDILHPKQIMSEQRTSLWLNLIAAGRILVEVDSHGRASRPKEMAVRANRG
jgi:hypothetical protein